MLAVLFKYVNKRLAPKSKEQISDNFKQQASDTYFKIGTHLLEARCKTISSEALLPILQKIALKVQ